MALFPLLIRTRLRAWMKRRSFLALHAKFAEFTMVTPHDYVTNLELCASVEAVEGAVVECGVWRGGMSAGMAAVLGTDRAYYLFDSFEGLPPPDERDSGSGSVDYDNCSADIEWAKKAMNLSGVRKVHLVKGWFSDTVPQSVVEGPIAVLRLDGDWYDSTWVCLERFWDQVTPGGVVIIDDYFAWDGCALAVHDFLSKRQAKVRMRNLGKVAYILR